MILEFVEYLSGQCYLVLNAEGYRLNYCREFPKSINIVEYVH